MTDGEATRPAQGRDPSTGRLTAKSPRPEPEAPLLDYLRPVASRAARKVSNDPRVAVHVERMVLYWLMHWDPSKDRHVAGYIGLRAGNEARRVAALSGQKFRDAVSRSNDVLRLARRVHRPTSEGNSDVPTVREERPVRIRTSELRTSENTGDLQNVNQKIAR